MNTPEDLLASLLRKQNITDFHGLKINGKNSDYYGYTQSGSFYFCDKDFSVIERKDIGIQECVVIRIGKDGDCYYWPFNGQPQSIVVDGTNKIISTDTEGFFEIDKETFLMHDPIWINDYSRGIVFNVESNKFDAGDCENSVFPIQHKKPVLQFSYLHWLDKKIYIDEESPINPYVNGVKDETLQYLFSYKDENDYWGFCSSYFVNKSDKTVIVITTSKNKRESHKVEFKAQYIWLSESFPCCIGLEIIKPSPKDYFTSPKLCVKTYAYTQGKQVSNVDVKRTCLPCIHNIAATKNYLVIVGEYDKYSQIVVAIDEFGFTLTNRGLYLSQIERRNNVLSIKNQYAETILYDLLGKKMVKESRETICSDYIVFERNLTVPTRFNDIEISAQLQSKDRKRELIFEDLTENIIYDSFMGVMNNRTMEVIVPPCYSFVKPYSFKTPFSIEEYPLHRLFTIVRIDNYYKGKKESVFGAYLDERIVLPIGFKNIEVLNYTERDYDGKEKQYLTDFVLLENDKGLGLATTWGKVIIEPSAESIDLLNNGEDEPIYAKISENGEKYLVYKTKIIKINGLDNAETTIWSCSGNPFVKVVKEGLCGIMYKGEMLTDFYSDIKPRPSLYGQKEQDDDIDYVFIVEDEDGNKGVTNCRREVIVPIEHSYIEVYQRMALIDGTFYNESGEKVFCTKDYLQVDKKVKQFNLCNVALFCFKNDDGYVIVDVGNGTIDKFDAIDLPEETPLYNCLGEYVFDFEEEVFKEKEEENRDCSHSDDDYDYERDTYYALGGDDYDAFKERGGSIDDMMDGMGL